MQSVCVNRSVIYDMMSGLTFVVVVDEEACTMGTLAMFSAHLVSEHFGDGQN